MRAIGVMMGWLLASGAAVAQVAPPPATRAPQVSDQLFIAPSGEPFRAPAGAPYPVGVWFASADTNRDGRVSQGEFSAGFTRFFDSLDVDRDSMIRSEEIQHYEKNVLPEVRSFGSGFGGWGPRSGFDSSGEFSRLNQQIDTSKSSEIGKSPELQGDRKFGPMGAGRYALINIPQPVAAMDTDFNGVVSRNEMLSAARRRFKLLDPDEKGSLAPTDLPQTWAQSHPRRERKER